jgi:hypothetical protein
MVDNALRIQADVVLTLLDSGSRWLTEQSWAVVPIPVAVGAKAYDGAA